MPDRNPFHPAARPPSPLLGRTTTGAGPAARAEAPEPAAHTDAELATLLDLLAAARPRATTVTVGHSRDAASRAAAASFVTGWQAGGGTVLAVVDWPEQAASWLRAARRFAAGPPDAWVVAAAPLGWAQMSRRLRHSTDWDPRRSYGFASAGDPAVTGLAGEPTLRGMRGATRDGGTWQADGEWLNPGPPGPSRRAHR